MTRPREIRIQKWGDSLAVRIPAIVPRRTGFVVGQPVRISMQDSAILVSRASEPVLTLAQRLALFDPERHGGEAMATGRTGLETIG